MILSEHESYARELLSSLSNDQPEIESVTFIPDRSKSRNAAKAMTVIFCHRLLKTSGHPPTLKENTTYDWKQGVFNCRNIADRDYLWTNMRRNAADKMHDFARSKPAAYLLAFSNPSDTTASVWAAPEPILYSSLSNLPVKEGGDEYAIQIFTNKHRFESDDASSSLAPYFQEFPLTRPELLVLRESRVVDTLVKRQRRAARDTTKSLNRCAITGCNLEPLLDAAHIIAYRGPETNHPGNGLLLRTDLHTLFDLKLIAIDVTTMRLLISSTLVGTCYKQYRGSPIKVPDDPASRPSREALEQHRMESGL
jgi:hypothetical protein